jgi:prepilin-type N-terminal cleavage/methylation domain-containing protein
MIRARGFALPEVVIALMIVSFMVPGVLAYQATALSLVARGRLQVEAAGAARMLLARQKQHEKDTKKTIGSTVLRGIEQEIPKDSPLASYAGLSLALVIGESEQLPQRFFFATVISTENDDKARV